MQIRNISRQQTGRNPCALTSSANKSLIPGATWGADGAGATTGGTYAFDGVLFEGTACVGPDVPIEEPAAEPYEYNGAFVGAEFGWAGGTAAPLEGYIAGSPDVEGAGGRPYPACAGWGLAWPTGDDPFTMGV